MDGAGDFRLKALVQTGLNSFIDLTQEGELTRYGTLRPYAETGEIKWCRHIQISEDATARKAA